MSRTPSKRKVKKKIAATPARSEKPERIAIFSDIHSNLEALHAVMEDMREQKINSFICLGDVVGYNANPSECLQAVRALNCPVIRGNHDNEASSDNDLVGYRDLARISMGYSRLHLSAEEKQYLGSLPLMAEEGHFSIVHASLFKPEEFLYVDSPLEAAYHFMAQGTQLCFCGHTHVPQVYTKSGRIVVLEGAYDFQLERGIQYLVNVGSVGQPRDRDWRACYVIYDPDERTVRFRRVQYDIGTAQRKIEEAGLPQALADRLLAGV
jgi:predicted phosphodiesterase